MVMHARKQPRLNDGYADRKDAHLHQDMQYHSSLFADDSDDDGPIGSRISPRYQNKSSYIERNKEKRGSLSLAEKKVSHYLATGSLGRPIPLESSFPFGGGEHSSGGGVSDPNRCATSTSGQRKERAGSQGERGFRDHNSHQGSKPEYKISTQPSSSSHYNPAEHVSRGASQQQTPGGEYNSHGEKDNRTHSSSATNNGKQTSTGKDKEVQKSAIRVCGDWSEHISSSGKRYYYNCKTEVSQWEKPKEWNSEMCRTPDHRSKDGRPKMLTQAHANKITADSRASRHSSSSEHQQHEQARGHRVNSGDSASESQHSRDPNTHQHYRETRESRDSQHLSRDNSRDSNMRELHKAGVERTRSGDSTSSNSHPHYHHHQGTPHRSGSTPGGNNGVTDSQYSDYKRSQQEGQYSHSDYKRSGNEASRRKRVDSQGSQRHHDTGQVPIDDMDISPSPSPSPSSSRPSSAAGTPQLPPTSTPIATSTTPAHNPVSTPGGGHRSASPLGNPIPTLVNRQTVNEGGNYDKTIQTLQELQKALSMHIHRAQQSTTSTRPSVVQPHIRNTSTPMSSHQMTPPQHLIYPAGQAQGPHVVPGPSLGAMPPRQSESYTAGLQSQVPPSSGVVAPSTHVEDTLGRTSPVSATSSQSSCGSPTPSDSSSQNATALSSQALTAAAMKREETAKLTASLSNFYNEKLIGHVLGWQADIVERQAGKLWEESMVNGSLQCSQISVQLKKARSQVRSAEIQSTLDEQRIMSSDQQRQEIENLKTPSSFLPS